MRVRLSMVRRNSFSNVSEMIWPVFASTEACPETNTKPPALMAGENGRWLVGTSGPWTTSMGIDSLLFALNPCAPAKVDEAGDDSNEPEARGHPRDLCAVRDHHGHLRRATRVRHQLLVRP